ncbi:MAG: acyltransferase [Microthrixaceae bacterium]
MTLTTTPGVATIDRSDDPSGDRPASQATAVREAEPVRRVRRRRPDLAFHPAVDGLRAVAIAGVIANHLGWMSGGFLGVDLFFLLSGFLITRIIMHTTIPTGVGGFKTFWSRRAARLVPAMAVLWVAVVGYLAFAPPSQRPEGIGRQFVGALTWTSNWEQLLGSGYWSGFGAASPLRHLWSLAIEEQFYLVFPIVLTVVVASCRRRTARVATVLALGAAASTAWAIRLVASGASADRVYLGTDTRLAPLLLGGALAAWTLRRRPSATYRRVVTTAALPAAVIVAVLWTLMTVAAPSAGVWSGFPLSEVASLVVLAACVLPPGGGLNPIAAVLSVRPLRWIGRLSYSIYLFHWPIHLWLAAAAPDMARPAHTAVVVVAAVAVSAAVTRWVELPIRSSRTLTRARLLGVASVTVVVVASAMVLAAATTPVGLRSTGSVPGETTAARAASTASRVRGATGVDGLSRRGAIAGAATTTTAPATTTTPAGTGPVRMLVLGDSVAKELGGALRAASTATFQIGDRAEIGCGPFTTTPVRRTNHAPIEIPERCRTWRRSWDSLLMLARPTTTMLMTSVASYAEARIDGTWRACSPEYGRWYADLLNRDIADIVRHGSTVQLPTMALNRSNLLSTAPPDVVALDDRNTDCVNSVVRFVAAAHPDTVHLLDLRRWVCPNDCETWDRTLRPDGLHFQGPGATRAVSWLLAGIEAGGLAAGPASS